MLSTHPLSYPRHVFESSLAVVNMSLGAEEDQLGPRRGHSISSGLGDPLF